MITSQNDTAPKHKEVEALGPSGVITSQNDTAPKHAEGIAEYMAV